MRSINVIVLNPLNFQILFPVSMRGHFMEYPVPVFFGVSHEASQQFPVRLYGIVYNQKNFFHGKQDCAFAKIRIIGQIEQLEKGFDRTHDGDIVWVLFGKIVNMCLFLRKYFVTW